MTPSPLPMETRIRVGGLRYESKSCGSNAFPGSLGSSISCICCGQHRPRSTLVSFLLAGRRQYRCRGGC